MLQKGLDEAFEKNISTGFKVHSIRRSGKTHWIAIKTKELIDKNNKINIHFPTVYAMNKFKKMFFNDSHSDFLKLGVGFINYKNKMFNKPDFVFVDDFKHKNYDNIPNEEIPNHVFLGEREVF